MALLCGRETFGWKETSIPLPSSPSPSSIPFQQQSQKESTVEEEQQPLDAAIKSDSQLLKQAQNGLKSLQGKLELVILAKKENDAFFCWEFPLWLSQSQLGGRTKPSDACTLISMSIAHSFLSDVNLSNILSLDQEREGFTEEQQLAMNWHKVCPPELIRLMKEAIVKGNAIYDKERKRGIFSVFYAGILRPLKEILTIPDAVHAWNREGVEESLWSRLFCGFMRRAVREMKDHSEMCEIDYIAVKGSIGANLPKCADFAIRHAAFSGWNILCFIIVCKEKAISLVYRRDTDLFCVFDSHEHDWGTNGAIVAVSHRSNFPKMAMWMECCLFRSHLSEHQTFEFSLVQMTNGEAFTAVEIFANFPPA